MLKENPLWVERYRPRKVEDAILPIQLKKTFIGFRDNNLIQNMTLSGTPGTGKTTVAMALCDDLDVDYLKINCSENGNIDTLRTDIRQFASTMSFNGGRKCVILDEADGLSETTQKALRNFIEEFSGNCSFIFTCNYKNNIIPALRSSRCPLIEFKIPKEERPALAKQMHKRVAEILKKEDVKYDDAVLAKLVTRFFPDFRETLGQIQKYAVTGEIDAGILSILEEIPIGKLIEHMKKKQFGEVRKWVAQYAGNEPMQVYRSLFDAMNTHLKPSFIPQFVLILGDFIDQSSRSTDQEICMLAFLTMVMADEEFETV